MGLLDDAIREHLDLKRRRGADPTEVEQAEREALGPVRRDPFEDGDELSPASDEAAAHDREDAVYDDEYHEDGREAEPWDDLDEPLPEEPKIDEHLPAAEESIPAPHPAGEESIPAPYSAGAAAGDETVEYDIEEAYHEESVEPLEPSAPPEPGVPPGQGVPDEPGVPPEPSGPVERHPPESPAAEPAEELESEPTELHHPGDEDMLEETPEFLQDTPDHDRLWFEQRPPKDFDFDG